MEESGELTSEEERTLVGVYKEPEQIVEEYAMETWLEPILPYTFRTVSFELTKEELDTIVLCNQARFKKQVVHEAQEVLRKLEGKIDAELAKFGGCGFVKLNTRSPKDSLFEMKNERVIQELRKETQALIKKKGAKNITVNDQFIAVTTAANRSMKITSGREALQLLISSERVRQDIAKALSLKQQGRDFPIRAIIREWIEIPIQNEFRGYVCRGKLNGLSQCVLNLSVSDDKIAGDIQTYWRGIKDLILHESYVVDFALLTDGTIKVIEINPFHYSTGAPFFHWKTGSEGRKRLIYGPFEFRVREDFPPDELLNHYMATPYEKEIKSMLEEALSNSWYTEYGTWLVAATVFCLSVFAWKTFKK